MAENDVAGKSQEKFGKRHGLLVALPFKIMKYKYTQFVSCACLRDNAMPGSCTYTLKKKKLCTGNLIRTCKTGRKNIENRISRTFFPVCRLSFNFFVSFSSFFSFFFCFFFLNFHFFFSLDRFFFF